MKSLIGKNVFIRTVTFHYTGEMTSVQDGFVVLKNAAWIADSGRFSDAMKTGSLNEVEPYDEKQIVYVHIDSIVDIVEWLHELPRVNK